MAEISEGIRSLFIQSAGQYPVVFGMDGGAFLMDVEKKSTETLPFFGVFFTGRFSATAFGEPAPNYEVYAFYDVDFSDEQKEIATSAVFANQLLREFVRNLSPYLNGRPTSFSHWHGHAVSAVFCEVSLAPPTDCEGQPEIVTPKEILLNTLEITSNGEYSAAEGTAWDRVHANVPQLQAEVGNLFTRTHTLDSLREWNITAGDPILDIPGWQVTVWGTSTSSTSWSSSGDIIYRASETVSHTTSLIQILVLENKEYLIKFKYISRNVPVLIWCRTPWDGAGQINIATFPASATWADAEARFVPPPAALGRTRFCITQKQADTSPLFITRPLLVPIDSGISDYVPSVSDIVEGEYQNAPFLE